MIVIWTIILMLLGICFLINETNKFEKAQTMVNAIHITKATLILDVTARAEQMPKICNAIGLFEKRGSKRVLLALDIFKLL
tara:strand:- start:683 stop:925 length:243 start_codon:yes stop_codon:yes gene_type:complete